MRTEGILFIALAGVMAGIFMLPAKYVKRWKWENLWLLFNVVSLVLAPGMGTPSGVGLSWPGGFP